MENLDKDGQQQVLRSVRNIFTWQRVYTLEEVVEFAQRLNPDVELNPDKAQAALMELSAEGCIRTWTIESGASMAHVVAWNPAAELPPADSVSKVSVKRRSLDTPFRTPKRANVLGKGLLLTSKLGQRTPNDVQARLRAARAKLHDEREVLRKLQLLKKHKENDEKGRLTVLVNKWRSASQEAATALLKVAPDGFTMGQLLQATNIDYSLIHYNPEDECFE